MHVSRRQAGSLAAGIYGDGNVYAGGTVWTSTIDDPDTLVPAGVDRGLRTFVS